VPNHDTLEVSGLQLSNNDFTGSPPGSLAKADNCVISQKGVIQPRNGNAYQVGMASQFDLAFALAEFQGNLIVQYGLSKTDTSQALGYVGFTGSSVNAYSGGPFNPVGDNGSATDYMRMKFCLASLFMHFCCASQPKCLETFNGTPRMAGLSRMPDPGPVNFEGFNAPGSALDWMPYNTAVGYRTVLRRATSSGVSLLSPPSAVAVVTNRFLCPIGGLVRTGGNLVTATFPSRIDVNVFAGSTFTISPGEANFAAGTYTVGAIIANNAFTFTSVGANVANTVAEEINFGPLSTQIVAFLPDTAIAGDFVRLYRSVPTSSSSIAPSENLYLTAEVVLTAGHIAAGAVAIFDYTPVSIPNDPLYTNPADGDGSGLDGGNLQPPIYGDVTNFDSATWYCNTRGQQSMNLEMLGVGATAGIQNNDTITIADSLHSFTLTFKTTAVGATDVQIYSDGTPSENITWTTKSLVSKFVQNAHGFGWAMYSNSSVNSFPGKVQLARTDFSTDPIQVKVSRPSSWTPALASGTFTNSTGDARANGLCNSKLAIPEAVPTNNFRNVGVPNFYARRIFGLRNALIILKEGEGIWSLTGTAGDYNLVQISNANIIAPDCAVVCADAVWAYTDQGILRITDSGGCVVVSRAIETELIRLATLFPAETYAWSFAVAYETERRIMFFVPTGAGTGQGGSPQLQAYCYSLAANAWTGPVYVENTTATAGLVTTAKKLWLGLFDSALSVGLVSVERKTDSYLDLADGGIVALLTTTPDPRVIQLVGQVPFPIVVGSGIEQNPSGLLGGTVYRTKVSAVLGNNLYRLAETQPFVTSGGAVPGATIYSPYLVEAQFLPQGDPASRKALTRITTLYKQDEFANYFGNVTVETDAVQDEFQIPATFMGFGMNPFGATPFGDPTPLVVDSNPNDPKWVNAGQFRVGVRLHEVWVAMKLQGMKLNLEAATGPAGRGGKPG
jgi:hypothetical protein